MALKHHGNHVFKKTGSCVPLAYTLPMALAAETLVPWAGSQTPEGPSDVGPAAA